MKLFLQARQPPDHDRQTGQIIAVTGARGGAGATTLAAGIAIAAANSADLLDCQHSGSRVEVVVTLPKPQALRRLVGKRKIRAAAAAEIYWVDESNFSEIPE